jgi:hypothetical protein
MPSRRRLLLAAIGLALAVNSHAAGQQKDLPTYFDPDKAFTALLQAPPSNREQKVHSLAQTDGRWVKRKSLVAVIHTPGRKSR